MWCVSEFAVDRPSLVLKARHLGGSALCNFHRLGVPEQPPGGIPLGLGIVVEDKPPELVCFVHVSVCVYV